MNELLFLHCNKTDYCHFDICCCHLIFLLIVFVAIIVIALLIVYISKGCFTISNKKIECKKDEIEANKVNYEKLQEHLYSNNSPSAPINNICVKNTGETNIIINNEKAQAKHNSTNSCVSSFSNYGLPSINDVLTETNNNEDSTSPNKSEELTDSDEKE